MDPPIILKTPGAADAPDETDAPILPLGLTEVSLDLIFTKLEGGSLSACKLVSRAWYHYIQGRIWGYQVNIRELKKTLEKNIRIPKYLHVPNVYVDLPITGYVSGTTTNKVAVRSYARTSLAVSSICVYDVSTQEFWNIPHLFPAALRAQSLHEEFMLTLSERYIIVRVTLAHEVYVDAWSPNSEDVKVKRKRRLALDNVQIFSLESHIKIHDENMVGLETIGVSRIEDNSHLIVFFRYQCIDIFDCSVEWAIIRRQINIDPHIFMHSDFEYPNILLKAFVDEERRHTIKVWDIEVEEPEVKLKVDVVDIDHFFCDGKTALRDPITEIKYIRNFFLTCTIITLPGQDGNNSAMAFRTYSNQGQILQQVYFLDANPHDYVKFHCFGERVLAEIDCDLWVFKGNKDDLGKRSSKEPEFTKYNNLPLVCHPMIGMVQTTEARTVDFWGGFQLLRLCSINFWKRH